MPMMRHGRSGSQGLLLGLVLISSSCSGDRPSPTASDRPAGPQPAYDLVVVETDGDVITRKTYPVDPESGRFADAEHTSVNRTDEPLPVALEAPGITATGTVRNDANGHLWLTQYEITVAEITWSVQGGLHCPKRTFGTTKGEKTAITLGQPVFIGGTMDAGKSTDVSIELHQHPAP